MSYGWNNEQPYFGHNLREDQFPSETDKGNRKLKAKAYFNPEIVNCEFIKKTLSKNGLQGPKKILVNPNFRGNLSNKVAKKTHFQLNNLVQVNSQSKVLSEAGPSNATADNDLMSISRLPLGGNEKLNNTTVVTHQSRFKKVNLSVNFKNKSSSQYSWSKDGSNFIMPNYSCFSNKTISVPGAKSFGEKQKHTPTGNAYKYMKASLQYQNQICQTSRNVSIFKSRTKIINDSKTKPMSNVSAVSKLGFKDKKICSPVKRHLNSSKYSSKYTYNNKISPVTKVAKAVRTKYKYLNNLEQFKKSKYKIDKRNKLQETVKKKLNMFKDIRKLFPDYFYNKMKLTSYKIYQVDNCHVISKSVSSWRKNHSSSKTNHRIINQFPNRRVVKIGGILYKSTTNKLTLANKSVALSSTKHAKAKRNHIVYVRGEKFILEKNGKVLRRQSQSVKNNKNLLYTTKRIDIGGVTYIQKSQNVLIRTNVHRARYLVNKAKNKSIAVLANLHKKSSLPCMIYHRFGKCNRHTKGLCIYKHDPKNIAICKNFIKGNCANENCLLSHEVIQEKMATCHFFLNGSCNRENCPFLHVKLNEKVAICEDFLGGFCNLGKSCPKRHFHQCPNFDKYGSCSVGSKCLYPHKKQINIATKHICKKSANSKDQSQAAQCHVCSNVLKKSKKIKKVVLKEKESDDRKISKKPEKRKVRTLNNAQQSNDVIACFPKRIRLDKLPCYIPLKSDS